MPSFLWGSKKGPFSGAFREGFDYQVLASAIYCPWTVDEPTQSRSLTRRNSPNWVTMAYRLRLFVPRLRRQYRWGSIASASSEQSATLTLIALPRRYRGSARVSR